MATAAERLGIVGGLFVAALLGGLAFAAAAGDVTRYVRYEHGGRAAYGVVEGETIFELAGSPYAKPARTGLSLPMADVTLLPPSEPTKVLAVALNFRSHGGERGAARPELFAKLPSSLIGSGAPIVVPGEAVNLHYEGELVVVIGKRARNVTTAEASDYIFGVTAGNDVSERGWQGTDMQWLRAKGADGFGPVGPVLVRGLDYADLMIETHLNGERRQAESTKNLIHGVDAVVSYASRYFTLEPGDMIFTGTTGQTRPMRVGDEVEVRIEGVGVLRNKVVAAPAGR